MAKPSILDKLKKEAKRVNDVEESRGDFTRMFKPEKGDNLIRILPHWDPKKRSDGDELFFSRRLVHYLPTAGRDGGQYNAPYRCLKDDQEETCPACQVFSRLKKAQHKKANDFRPTERYLYNIIDYGMKGGQQVEPSVVVYAAPFSIHKEVMNWVEELGTEFWDIENGRDWKLKKIVDASKGARNGTSYKLMPKLQDSAVPKKLLPLLDNMANLGEMWGKYDIVGMAKALKLAGQEVEDEEEESDDEVEEEEEEQRPRKKAKAKEEEKDDGEEEEEEDDDEADDEDEEEKAAASRKPKAKSKAADDEEEEEDDEDDEEEEADEEEVTKKPVKVEAKKKKKSADSEIDDELRALGV